MNEISIILTNFLKAAREAHAAAVLPVPAKASAPTPSAKAAPARKTKAAKAPTYDVKPPATTASAIPSAEKLIDPAGDAWAKAIREVNGGVPGSTPPQPAEPQADRSAMLFAQVEAWIEEGR